MLPIRYTDLSEQELEEYVPQSTPITPVRTEIVELFDHWRNIQRKAGLPADTIAPPAYLPAPNPTFAAPSLPANCVMCPHALPNNTCSVMSKRHTNCLTRRNMIGHALAGMPDGTQKERKRK